MHAFLTFLPKLTYAAARSLCDSWASCITQDNTDQRAYRPRSGTDSAFTSMYAKFATSKKQNNEV